MNKKTKKATFVCTECKISKCKLETEGTTNIRTPKETCPYLINGAYEANWKRVKEKK